MNVLVMTDHFPPDNLGGAGQVAWIQCRALQQLGHQVQVLSARRDDSTPADLDVGGVPVHRLTIAYPLRWHAYLSLYNPAAARQVSAYLDSVRPDVVHAHNVHTYLTYHSLALAKRRGLPVLLTMHDTMVVTYQKFDSFIDPIWADVPAEVDYRVRPWSQIRKQRFRYFPPRNAIIRSKLRRNVDAIITPSRVLQDVLRANHIHAPQMIHLPNGIDPARFESSEADQAAFRAEHELEGKRVILFAGRINRAKGGEQLLRALPQVVARVPEAVLLVLARPGGYGEGMLSIAESLGIRQHIRFAGWLSGETLAAAFGAADVCVTPSVYFDNFPTVNLEAQAAGTPVVGTCFGGTPEAVVDGETGFIVNPYNVDQLAGRIGQLLRDDALRAQMGAQARQQVAQHYHWLTQGEKLVNLYQQILDRS
jgi:glycosyltransferase involved in cell wall biosynthesis